jgi:preprotein translocase subunit SecA
VISALAKKLFGSANDRLVKSMEPQIRAINAREEHFAAMSDSDLKAQTNQFRLQLNNGIKQKDLMVDAFAVVREASKRALGMRPFDVQLIGGMTLNRGLISEMKTGEGKTLVATLPAYLNAISGKGVHIVTVNDYLAQRDAAWMGKVFNFLGLSVGVIHHGLEDGERKTAYACDITYATNNELGFDYLRDNMKYSRDEMVQRPFNYAIIDEVDSILIDEARTPLIISGPTEDNSELYVSINLLIPKLTEDDYEMDEKSKNVSLNEQGVQTVETLLTQAGQLKEGTGLYDIENVLVVHHVNQALKAHKLFQRDTDYIVKDQKVIIIDEFTGRMMEGRRYSEGLHQALEAKENAIIQNENQTLASITFQNYFRLYPKLAGMTGTAMTEAAEFNDIYRLDVVDIPTNVPVTRADHDDEIYRTSDERDKAVTDLIKECHARKQPMLVGTVSIDKSEAFSERLKQENIPHQVLNARYHEQEAYIIAQAGRPGAVTIATNMAGRGTDIVLGGNVDMRIAKETDDMAEDVKKSRRIEAIKAEMARDKQTVIEAGGLFVIGTERHESRRIDNQLRGRSGRQGDPGASKFFLSLQDDLMRIFGSERMDGMLKKLGLKEDEAIFHPWMNKAIERAQTKVEQRNYEIRKTLLKFDDVMNDQRKVIYEERIDLMETDDVSDTVSDMVQDVTGALIAHHIPKGSYAEQWDMDGLHADIYRIFGLDLPVQDWAAEEGIGMEEIHERVDTQVQKIFTEKGKEYGDDVYKLAEKRVLLQTLDQLWKDHLLSLDHLRQGINLRAYAQRDPLNEYKQEAFTLFEAMLTHLREVVVTRLSRLEIKVTLTEDIMRLNPQRIMREGHGESEAKSEQMGDNILRHMSRQQVRPENRDPANPESWGKIGRNEACPCGSNKKFKHCHGQIA